MQNLELELSVRRFYHSDSYTEMTNHRLAQLESADFSCIAQMGSLWKPNYRTELSLPSTMRRLIEL